MSNIKQNLENIAKRYNPEDDLDYYLIRYGVERIQENLEGDRVLEMGCSSGIMTSELVHSAKELHVVEGAEHYIKKLKHKPELKEVTFFHTLFEKFQPETSYTDIILASALEHLTNPTALLKRIAGWLTEGGILHVIVPNAGSLHRRVGVALGMLEKTTDKSPRDHLLDHKRVYTKELLEKHLQDGGFHITHGEGIFLKPLSNAQMEDWSEELLDAFNEVGKQLPEWCTHLYLIAEAD